MSNIKVKRKYGDESFAKLFNTIIDEKINEIKIKANQKREARHSNINYPSTTKNEVDKNE